MKDARVPVLVVDDHPDIRRTLREVLEFEGYTTHEACDGEEALAGVAREAGPCIVLLDIEMPRMDGITFLRELARSPSRHLVAVVVMSARPESPRFLSLDGVSAVLTKPFGIEKLLPALERARGKLLATPAMASESAPERE